MKTGIGIFCDIVLQALVMLAWSGEMFGNLYQRLSTVI
jgi:hypothetical protein